MIWKAEKIKELRLRLGWSKAEFARRFGGTVDLISAWESGEHTPTTDDIDQFETLSMQISEYSNELKISSLCRQNMKENALNQIPHSEIVQIED